MKLSTSPRRFLSVAFLSLLLSMLSSFVANAHPYASNITGTNNAGLVSFTLNEDGAFVTVVYEDGTTNSVLDGSAMLSKGPQLFYLEPPHVGFKIICFKTGTGQPSIISSDAVGVYTYSNSVWNSPRGVGVNKNAAIGPTSVAWLSVIAPTGLKPAGRRGSASICSMPTKRM